MHIETCLFPTAVRPLLIWYDQEACGCTARTIPLIAKIELTHSIASIHSSCSQGRMRFSTPTANARALYGLETEVGKVAEQSEVG